MRCTECGAEIPEGSRFCNECGAEQPESSRSGAELKDEREDFAPQQAAAETEFAAAEVEADAAAKEERDAAAREAGALEPEASGPEDGQAPEWTAALRETAGAGASAAHEPQERRTEAPGGQPVGRVDLHKAAPLVSGGAAAAGPAAGEETKRPGFRAASAEAAEAARPNRRAEAGEAAGAGAEAAQLSAARETAAPPAGESRLESAGRREERPPAEAARYNAAPPASRPAAGPPAGAEPGAGWIGTAPYAHMPSGSAAYAERGASPAPGDAAQEPLAVRLTQGGGDGAAGAPPQMWPVGGQRGYAPPASAAQTSAAGRPAPRGGDKRRSPLAWLAPVLLGLAAAGLLTAQVSYERGVNGEAAADQQGAAQAALGGNYEIAEAKLDEALERRPDDPGLKTDLQTVQDVRRLDGRLGEAQQLITSGSAEEAQKILGEVENELGDRKSGAYDRVRERLNRLRERTALAGIRGEAERAATLDELAGLLKTASASPSAEKEGVVGLITNRIVDVTGDEAEAAIASGSYYEAAAVIDEGRGYAPESERLIELEKQVSALASKEKSSMPELARLTGAQLREDGAELALADLRQAETGRGLSFSGMLTNTTDQAMYDLLVEYRIYSPEGSFLGEDWTEVRPADLKPGASGNFAAASSEAPDDAIVVIDSVSWYRE
ncbi:zinc-ribbon domain-containing protein [Saccharibacillus sp. CPCC 101409]|uniref:zinc-ribbon domain-containing protein n=1 Tax=Saccharibacillus sp. CPCC 101409 TaxID=3058041 RepID=UPI00267141BD|nr:zinc-ribbon domain-containing protein [Saccharibacillus sp. CPCC 101409]MDO3412719.1 zinc-ribbon domain-containing protein [Saccharibacillus sp. CPCC 101409]